MKSKIIERKICRLSGEKLVSLFSLGEICVSDFVPQQDDRDLLRRPVELKLCLAPRSGLVQLAHTTRADDMYARYWYKSGTNQTMTNELKQIAESSQELAKTKKGNVFVDIGCNDGTLLRFLNKDLIRIGFDPAKNIVEESKKYGSLIINDYFNYKTYKNSKYGDKKATAVTSIAMFYDLEDPHSFIKDVDKIMDKNGLWVIQMSYLPLMLKQLAFDNICHEHLEYYSLTSLKYLLNMHGFKVVDCQLNDVNGGSFRIYARKQKADPTKFATAPYRDVAAYRIGAILTHEKSLKLNDPKIYKDFYKKINTLKTQTVNFIRREKKNGKSIWGYGASTKGNTLLQWFGLDNTLIDAIAERSPAKYNLRTAGTNIPIKSEGDMRRARPDYLLILPWHFVSEFQKREVSFLKRGGKFIVPCPKFEIIGENSK
jgi:hypothetical protein